MRTGVTISTVGHALVLAWALLSFSAKPFRAQSEALPVDVISAAEFSQMVAGSKTAPKTAPPKPLVEKVADAKPVDNPAAKAVDKPEIQTASTEATPPAPEPPPKPPETKVEEKKPEPKTDPIAEAIKKDEARKPDPPKPPAPPVKKPPQPKLDMTKIENRLALLDKREQRRQTATGAVLNPTAGLGTVTGTAPQLSQNEIDALRSRLAQCWNPPAGVAEAKDLIVQVRIQLREDGSLATEPLVTNRVSHPQFQVAAESALRAVQRCAPFSFLPIVKYEVWRDMEVNFDPRDMFRG